jgi:predicted nucleic acid-binding protein
MRVLLDTNVVLDVLLNRQPWVNDAAAVWQANDDGRVIVYLAASTFTDIFNWLQVSSFTKLTQIDEREGH